MPKFLKHLTILKFLIIDSQVGSVKLCVILNHRIAVAAFDDAAIKDVVLEIGAAVNYKRRFHNKRVWLAAGIGAVWRSAFVGLEFVLRISVKDDSAAWLACRDIHPATDNAQIAVFIDRTYADGEVDVNFWLIRVFRPAVARRKSTAYNGKNYYGPKNFFHFSKKNLNKITKKWFNNIKIIEKSVFLSDFLNYEKTSDNIDFVVCKSVGYFLQGET